MKDSVLARKNTRMLDVHFGNFEVQGWQKSRLNNGDDIVNNIDSEKSAQTYLSGNNVFIRVSFRRRKNSKYYSLKIFFSRAPISCKFHSNISCSYRISRSRQRLSQQDFSEPNRSLENIRGFFPSLFYNPGFECQFFFLLSPAVDHLTPLFVYIPGGRASDTYNCRLRDNSDTCLLGKHCELMLLVCESEHKRVALLANLLDLFCHEKELTTEG